MSCNKHCPSVEGCHLCEDGRIFKERVLKRTPP